MAGLVFTSTLVGQLLFFEMTGVCSWALIAYYQDANSVRAAGKAMLLTHIGALGLYSRRRRCSRPPALLLSPPSAVSTPR